MDCIQALVERLVVAEESLAVAKEIFVVVVLPTVAVVLPTVAVELPLAAVVLPIVVQVGFELKVIVVVVESTFVLVMGPTGFAG